MLVDLLTPGRAAAGAFGRTVGEYAIVEFPILPALNPARDRVARGATAKLNIRPGDRRDLGQVLALYNHYIARSAATFEVARLRLADRQDWLQEHTSGGRYRLLVATFDGRVVGWATSSPFRPRAAYETTVETSVYCAPTVLGRGVGTQLYQALFRSIEGEDVERAVAGVTMPNPASVSLHRRFGFRKVGTFHRVGRKFDRYWDVTWFERTVRAPRASPARPSSLGRRAAARGELSSRD